MVVSSSHSSRSCLSPPAAGMGANSLVDISEAVFLHNYVSVTVQ